MINRLFNIGKEPPSAGACGAETRIAEKFILINYLMLNLFGFYHGNLGRRLRQAPL